jgi:hypothetical protein
MRTRTLAFSSKSVGENAAAMDAGARIQSEISPGPPGGVHQAVGRMQQATGAAGTIMLKLMTDPNVLAGVRLTVAECVFERVIKGIELEDVDARLTALEQAAPQA